MKGGHLGPDQRASRRPTARPKFALARPRPLPRFSGSTGARTSGFPTGSSSTRSPRAISRAVFRRVRPRLIFAPYWVDSHPDHVAATEMTEGRPLLVQAHQGPICRASPSSRRASCTTSASTCGWLKSPPSCSTSAPYWQRKRASIECYHSQFIAGRDPSFVDRLRDQASLLGLDDQRSTMPSRLPAASQSCLSSLRDLV